MVKQIAVCSSTRRNRIVGSLPVILAAIDVQCLAPLIMAIVLPALAGERIKRNFPFPTIRLPSSIIYIGKAGQMFYSFPFFIQGADATKNPF